MLSKGIPGRGYADVIFNTVAITFFKNRCNISKLLEITLPRLRESFKRGVIIDV